MQCTERGRVSNVNNTSACIIIVLETTTTKIDRWRHERRLLTSEAVFSASSILVWHSWYFSFTVSNSFSKLECFFCNDVRSSSIWKKNKVEVWLLNLLPKYAADCKTWQVYNTLGRGGGLSFEFTKWILMISAFLHALQRVAQRKERMRLK